MAYKMTDFEYKKIAIQLAKRTIKKRKRIESAGMPSHKEKISSYAVGTYKKRSA